MGSLATPELLRGLPPLMLVIGGNEMLLGDNLQFVSRAHAAGAPVQLEIYDGMWHDFIQYTEGCESFGPLREGAQAITKAAKFLRDGESCRVVCTGTNGTVVSGTAPMQWHIEGYSLPPIPAQSSECSAGHGH